MSQRDFIDVAEKLRYLEKVAGELAFDAEVLLQQREMLGRFIPGDSACVESISLGRAELTRLLLEIRQRRRDVVDDSLLTDVCWGMLLSIYLERLEKQSAVRTKFAMLSGHCPATTALRWLDVLEEQGLIQRNEDARDLRVKMVELTDLGVETIELYLANVGDALVEVLVKADSRAVSPGRRLS